VDTHFPPCICDHPAFSDLVFSAAAYIRNLT